MEKRLTIRDILPPVLIAEDRREIMEAAAEDVVAKVQQWYASKPESYFDGDHHPSGKARSFMRAVQTHWFANTARGAQGFDVYFSNPRPDGQHFGLLLHEYGGVIEPKSAKALTIPIDPEAHGVRASEYEHSHGELFLIESTSGGDSIGVLAWQDEGGDIIAAYALRRRATVPSLMERKGVPAIPPDDEMKQLATRSIAEALNAWMLPD